MKKIAFLVMLIVLPIFLAFHMQACTMDDESVDGLLHGDDDDDDDSAENENNNGEFGTNECGTYGASGCTDNEPRACKSADLANQDRYDNPEESACAPNLLWSDELAAVALAHSKDMCQRQFFAHINPDGEDPFDRMTDAGINWKAAGENLAYGTNLSAEQANSLWMDEPVCKQNHRSNLLSWNFTHIGVGVYDCGKNVYFSQNFAAFSSADVHYNGHPYCGPDF